MQELELSLEGIDLQSFWGPQDIYLKTIRSAFPTIKLVSRGSLLKVMGSGSELEKFEMNFKEIIKNFEKNGSWESTHELLEFIHDEEKDSSSKGKNSPENVIVHGPNGKLVRARTKNQRLFCKEAEANSIVFAIGPAGTGKTYTAVALAVKALKNKEVKRIILTRPAVEAGENLGFLPGDLMEKIDPYLWPLYDALGDMLTPEKLKDYIDKRIIEIAPLAFMRGRTLDNAFVILDEAQNATDLQLKMFLTRMGKNAQFIITGDLTQTDLPTKIKSGLKNAINILSGIDGISIVLLDEHDVVRHELVKKVIGAYEKSIPDAKYNNE